MQAESSDVWASGGAVYVCEEGLFWFDSTF